MIVSRTPFRVTLGGGGTDLPSYSDRHGGFVFAMAIDQGVNVSVHAPEFDEKIRFQHTETEVVDHPSELEHDLTREALKRRGIESRLVVSSTADLPGGVGLGSSGSYTVGLLAALRAHQGQPYPPEELAEEAFDLEANTLGKGVGRQDPYMVAFGGLSVIETRCDGATTVRRAEIDPSTLDDFVRNTRLYWTGVRRSASEVLSDQDRAMKTVRAADHAVVQDSLHRIKELGMASLASMETGDFDRFGQLMDEHWQHKKRLSRRVTIPGIDELYADIKARFGVLGGKVSGAGGGGFFCVYVPRAHDELDAFMASAGLERMAYGIAPRGAEIVFGA